MAYSAPPPPYGHGAGAGGYPPPSAPPPPYEGVPAVPRKATEMIPGQHLAAGTPSTLPGTVGKISVGLAWDSGSDVDASVALMRADGSVAEIVYYGNKTSRDGYVQHSGDDLTGDGGGDDEIIKIKLKKLAPEVAYVMVFINVFNRPNLSAVRNCYARLYHGKVKPGHKPLLLCDFFLGKSTGYGSARGVVMAVIARNDAWWDVHPLGLPCDGATAEKSLANGAAACLATIPTSPTQLFRARLTVTGAVGLPAADAGGTSDPLYIIRYGSGIQYKSDKVCKTLSPTWAEHWIELGARSATAGKTVKIRVEDWDRFSSNDLLCKTKVAVGALIYLGPGEHTVTLACHKDKRPIRGASVTVKETPLVLSAEFEDDLGVPPSTADHVIKAPDKTLSEIFREAGKRALGGGIPGAIAMGLQVGTLMWLRTTVNMQYAKGGTTTEAFRTLYKEGGVRRFYRGVGPALMQGPLSRFGDTAANAGVMSLMESSDSTRSLPTAVKTAAASGTAALWRIVLMPIDTMKTMLQVNGADGVAVLRGKLAASGPRALYAGALAAASATAAGHYPWFLTYNTLNTLIPEQDGKALSLLRSAVMGFTSSAVSDTTSNSIRVIKTTKQTSEVALTYGEAARKVIAADGLIGLFGRGLKTKILANGVQGLLFAVLWKSIQEALFPKEDQ